MSYAELYYDLVFVLSIVQLSHTMSRDYSLRGVGLTSVLVLACWWQWIYTTWVLNWIHADSPGGRCLVFTLMALGLVQSTSIPRAFDDHALTFAASHVSCHVGRSVYASYATRAIDEIHFVNFVRITVWMSWSGMLWIAGVWIWQPVLWIAALALELIGPLALFYVPGLNQSAPEQWDVIGGHMAERCALFVIICLGETILVMGEQFSSSGQSLQESAALFVAFSTSVSLWWTYFRFSHRQATRSIEASSNPGDVARSAFTYAHIPIIQGIIVTAVGNRFVLDAPDQPSTYALALAIVGGPFVFLAGALWFKTTISGHLVFCHVAGLAFLAIAGLTSPFFCTVLGLAGIVLLILLLVAFGEYHFEHSLGPASLFAMDQADSGCPFATDDDPDDEGTTS